MKNNNNNTLHFKLLPGLKVSFTQSKMQDFFLIIKTLQREFLEVTALREQPLKSSNLPSGVKSHAPTPLHSVNKFRCHKVILPF